jgi:hypothetical protein
MIRTVSIVFALALAAVVSPAAYRRLGRTSEADEEMTTYQKLNPAEQAAELR